MANPACMNMTRKPETSVQVKLMRDFVLAHLVGHIGQRKAGLGIGYGNIVDRAGEGAARIAVGECSGGWRLAAASFSSAADAEGGASARATIPAHAASKNARAQIQDAMRAILINSAPWWVDHRRGRLGNKPLSLPDRIFAYRGRRK